MDLDRDLGREIALRLRRIEGQVAGIQRMRDEDRCCVEVLDQLAAARAGLEAVALLLLERHVEECVQVAVQQGDAAAGVAELFAVVRRFVRSA